MAQPSRYQYQPVTGPVWRPPVAERLAWLPAGDAQPLRTLPSARKLGWYVLEPLLAPIPPYSFGQVGASQPLAPSAWYHAATSSKSGRCLRM